MQRPGPGVGLLAGVIAVAVVLAMGCQNNRIHTRDLEAEIARLGMPGAVAGGSQFEKWRMANVVVTYRTTLPSSELRATVDAALKRHGWTNTGETPVKVWGRPTGEFAVKYCKTPLTAEALFSTEAGEQGTYSLSLRWDADSEECSSAPK